MAEDYLNVYKELNEFGKCHALTASINLTPQDGLGISNSDMEQLGAKNYFDVDEILYYYLQNNNSQETLNKFNAEVAFKIISRYNNNFKLNLPITINREEYA